MCVYVAYNGVCLRLGDMLYVLCVYYKRNKRERGLGRGRGEGEKVYKVNRKRKKKQKTRQTKKVIVNNCSATI